MAATQGVTRSATAWLGAATFEHTPDSGQRFITDARLSGDEDRPRRGPSPMELLLGAVAGCTGIDVVGILRKARLEIRVLRITTEGERCESVPRAYQRIHLTYEIETDPPAPEKVRRAVELSIGKYCSVSATLAGAVAMSYTLRCHGEVHEGRIPGVAEIAGG
jgi:putative redox protein